MCIRDSVSPVNTSVLYCMYRHRVKRPPFALGLWFGFRAPQEPNESSAARDEEQGAHHCLHRPAVEEAASSKKTGVHEHHAGGPPQNRVREAIGRRWEIRGAAHSRCLLYTSDAADERS